MPARRLLAGAAVAAVAAALAAPLAAQQPDSARRAVRPRTLYEDLQLFSGVLNQIRVNHPDTTITPHDLIMAAIRGMVQAADPYSGVWAGRTISPEKQKLWLQHKLYPVGINFTYATGIPAIVSVTPGSSASRLDLLRGDELIAVDGQPVTAETEDELDMTLSGEKKSSVRLTFARRRLDGTTVQFDREIRRDKLPEEASAVPTAAMLDRETGYVRITSFDTRTVADELHAALGALEKQGMTRLVLDIRDNPGGYVDQAKVIAGEFLPKGTIVYTTEGRKAEVSKDTGRVDRSFWSREKRYPMILMINGGSASASELVAGSLQDHDRALIVGHPSHGKALLMGTFPIDDGGFFLSGIYLNIGRIRTPCGRVVQREYRGLRHADYRRRAGSVVDTAGRPSCRTDGGRTVYGGGGIYPDVVLPELDLTPVWLSRVREASLPFKWVGAHLTAAGSAYTTVDALAANPVVAGSGLGDFRRLATDAGITIPTDAEADRLLTRELLEEVAFSKWGDAGRYRIAAALDPEIRAAVTQFDKASAILAAAK